MFVLTEDTNSQGQGANDNSGSSTGLEANIAALLSYLLGFITGIVFFLVEKKSDFVKFHAMQSIVLFGGLFIVNFVLGLIPLLGILINFVIGVGSLVLWIVLMVKAYQGERFKLPVAGNLAEDLLKKFA